MKSSSDTVLNKIRSRIHNTKSPARERTIPITLKSNTTNEKYAFIDINRSVSDLPMTPPDTKDP